MIPLTPRRRTGLIRLARIVFGLVVVAVIVRVGAHHLDELRHVRLQVHVGWLLVAAPLTFAGGLLLPLAWRALMATFGTRLGIGETVRIWWLSQASRYVPTGLAAIASRAVMTAREGVSRSLTAFTVGVEIVLLVAWAGFGAGVFLPSARMAPTLRFLLAAGSGGLLLAVPFTLRTGGRWAQRLARWVRRSPGAELTAFRPAAGFAAVALQGLNAAAKSLGALFVAAALLPVHHGDAALVLGATNAAVAAGLIGFTPAGLGVREAVLAGLLQPRFGLGNAAALAVALRAWEFLIELVWLGIAASLRRSAHTVANEIEVP